MSLFRPPASGTPELSFGNIQELSQRLQRRVMRLLLLYDQRLFRSQFRLFFTASAQSNIPLLQQYDRYIKLLTFSDELLDDIIPRLRRQLSLQTSQISMQEEAPTSGEIDWRRTLQRSWNEYPDRPPLRFDTSTRRYSLASPANVFAVAVLLHYFQELQESLSHEFTDEPLKEQERRALTVAHERVERELAAPYARLLIDEAAQIDIVQLAELVEAQLPAGPGPYRDLIAWWQAFSDLCIGRALDRGARMLTGQLANAQTDARLYELWIVLELIDLLHQEQAISADNVAIATDQLCITFTWQGRPFRFTYHAPATPVGNAPPGELHAPGSPPPYTIEREHPLEVKHRATVIWREPAIILSAIYPDEQHACTPVDGLVKQLLGDMLLLGAEQGGIFLPLASSSQEHLTLNMTGNEQYYHAGMSADTRIQLYPLSPASSLSAVQDCLKAALDMASNHLPDRPLPACYGIYLDMDSVNAGGNIVRAHPILCPKPHIGKGVFDLVNDVDHCLKDPRLCHVIGQQILKPRIIRATTRDELIQQSNHIRTQNESVLEQAERAGDQTHVEELIGLISTAIGQVIEHYVRLRGNTFVHADMLEWVFGDYWNKLPRSLSERTRHILIDGECVWYEFMQTQVNDWGAAAIQYGRALESEINYRLYDRNQGWNYKPPKQNLMLGDLLHIYENHDKRYFWGRMPNKYYENARHNWALIIERVSRSGCDLSDFEQELQYIVDRGIVKIRNNAAHHAPVTHEEARMLRQEIIGSKEKQGILCWFAEHLSP